jgi:WD domain, G-beta repeat
MGELVAGYRYATALALSRDGKTLAAGLGQRAVSSGDRGAERGNVLVWNADTGKLRFTLRSQRGAIFALAFSPDDRWIVSGSLDGSIQYWDRTEGTLMATAMSGEAGSWLVLTAAGFYAGSEGSDANIAFVRGNNAIPATRVRDQLSQPDLVEQLLQGDPAGRYRDAARKLELPAVLKSGTR